MHLVEHRRRFKCSIILRSLDVDFRLHTNSVEFTSQSFSFFSPLISLLLHFLLELTYFLLVVSILFCEDLQELTEFLNILFFVCDDLFEAFYFLFHGFQAGLFEFLL